jgi:hypothetical protein
MQSAIAQTLDHKLPQLMRRHPAVLSAYLFGSIGVLHRRRHSIPGRCTQPVDKDQDLMHISPDLDPCGVQTTTI